MDELIVIITIQLLFYHNEVCPITEHYVALADDKHVFVADFISEVYYDGALSDF